MIAQDSLPSIMDSMTQFFNQSTTIELIKVEEKNINEVSAQYYENSKPVIASIIHLQGKINLEFLLMIPPHMAYQIRDFILGKHLESEDELDIYTISAVQEIANIITSALSNGLVKYLNEPTLPSPPEIICDFSGVIFEGLIMDIASQTLVSG